MSSADTDPTYVVTGCEGTYCTTANYYRHGYPRLNLLDLHKNHPEQFTLFILALTAIQYPDQPVPMLPPTFKPESIVPKGGHWYHLGGIHGIPYSRYVGDPPSGKLSDKGAAAAAASATAAAAPMSMYYAASTAADDENRFGGYCNHSSVLFPPWHRPCMLALEQSIGIAATKIAALMVQDLPVAKAEKWTTAAKELRWPFWDWTDPITLTEGLPKLIKDETVQIVTPAGNEDTVPNPMSHYRFPAPLDGQFVNISTNVPFTDGKITQEAYFGEWWRTCRWPGATTTPTDDYEKLDKELKRLYYDIRAKVAHLFTYESESDRDKWSTFWDEMSNTTVQSNSSKGDNSTVPKSSLELAHNAIHLIIGGVGHMGQNDYAGFDPLFWLHHANVDRIYALWEYCYKDYWVGAGYYDKETRKLKHFTQTDGGTYYQLDHTRLDQATDMLPFRKARDAYWTPMDARSLEVGYPDVFPKHYTYPVVEGVDVSKTVSDPERVKYRSVLQEHFGLRGTVDKFQKWMGTQPSPIFFNSITDSLVPVGISPVEKYRHFLVSVTLKQHAFNDSYSFEFSYQRKGAPVESQIAVLSRPKNTQCAACQGRYAEGNLVRGMIHIPSHHAMTLFKTYSEDHDKREGIEVIKSSFSAKLVGRGGHVFATARAGQVVPEADKIDAIITPSVKLFSAYAGLDGEEGPLSFFEWKDHEEVFAGCWKKGA